MIKKGNTLNNKLRFIVLNILAIMLFPLTLLILGAGWLSDMLYDMKEDYVGLYRKAFKE